MITSWLTLRKLVPILLLICAGVQADYDCLCSYSVEAKVLPGPSQTGSPIGYLYEFDCKLIIPMAGSSKTFTAIAYEHKLGYVAMTADTQLQICPGDPPATDALYTTTQRVTTTGQSTVTLTAPPTITSSTPRKVSSSTQSQASTTTSPHVSMTSPTTSSTIKTTVSTVKTTPSTVKTKPQTVKTTTRTVKTTSPTVKTTPSTVKTTQSTIKTTPSTVKTTQSTIQTTPSTIKTTRLTVQTTSPPVKTTSTVKTTSPTIKTTTTQQKTTSTISPLTSSTTQSSTPPTYSSTTRVSSSTAASTSTSTAPMTSSVPTTSSSNVNTSGRPLRFIGIGYDLLHGNPGGMERTLGGDDPGMKTHRRIFQLTAALPGANDTTREVEEVPMDKCVTNTEAFTVNDGKRYQQELLRHAVFSKDFQTNLTSEAFTLSREFLQVRQDTESYTSRIYRDLVSTCHLGTFRYRSEMANVSDFSVSANFASDVCALPETYNASAYLNFIEDWGMSIVMAVKVGTMKIARYRTNDQQIVAHIDTLHQTDSVIKAAGPYKGYGSSVTVKVTALDSLADTRIYGSHDFTAAVGTESNPAPVELTLYPLTEALDPRYWTMSLGQSSQLTNCPTMTTAKLTKLAENLRTALNQYTEYMRGKEGVQPLTDHALQMPLTWPGGTYTMIKAAPGCPASRVVWKTGFRLYDTEDHHAHNYFSPNVQNYISGSFAADNIRTDFCTKTQKAVDTEYNVDWPRGSYCITKYGDCPADFAEGYIFWDDDDELFGGSNNEKGGVVPDGLYGDNTQIYYCCRNDGPSSVKMLLPRERPFVLYRFGGPCQEVHGMHMQEAFVRWDDEDLRNKDSAGGAHPLDLGGGHDHKIYFCYYSEQTGVSGPAIVG